MKKIMILGASILQLPAIRKAKAMGYQVIAADMNADAIGFKEDHIFKEAVSTIDIPKVLETAKHYQIDGIMTLASDMPMRTIAAVAEELGLKGITMDTALKATNKALMRKTLLENEVPVPMFFKVSTESEFLKCVLKIKNCGYRCIVKPVDNSGSRGVTLLSDFDEQTVRNAYLHGKEFSRSGDILVEEYMEGPEVSVETISIDGICHVIQITDKLTTGAPYFVEMGHTQPSVLSDEIKRKISDTAKAAVCAIGIKDGPSHTEIKVTRTGPKIVELGARLGGDCITTHLVPLSTGIDMVECCINIAMGRTIDCTPKFHKGSAIRYFSSEAGTIHSILGADEARQIPGVKQISFMHQPGDSLSEIRCSSDRLGFVISQGNSRNEAVTACEQAQKMIRVEMRQQNESINL